VPVVLVTMLALAMSWSPPPSATCPNHPAGAYQHTWPARNRRYAGSRTQVCTRTLHCIVPPHRRTYNTPMRTMLQYYHAPPTLGAHAIPSDCVPVAVVPDIASAQPTRRATGTEHTYWDIARSCGYHCTLFLLSTCTCVCTPPYISRLWWSDYAELCTHLQHNPVKWRQDNCGLTYPLVQSSRAPICDRLIRPHSGSARAAYRYTWPIGYRRRPPCTRARLWTRVACCMSLNLCTIVCTFLHASSKMCAPHTYPAIVRLSNPCRQLLLHIMHLM
jgi:hypothetical protein